jgi:hypothetical protein
LSPRYAARIGAVLQRAPAAISIEMAARNAEAWECHSRSPMRDGMPMPVKPMLEASLTAVARDGGAGQRVADRPVRARYLDALNTSGEKLPEWLPIVCLPSGGQVFCLPDGKPRMVEDEPRAGAILGQLESCD